MSDRQSRLLGALFVALGAVAFSFKAILVKWAYRHGVDPVTLLALRMLFSAPLFALVAWWSVRGGHLAPLSGRDLRGVVVLGLVGYYLSSYFDFLGLQYVTAALERLLLFLNPTFVLVMAAVLYKRRITVRDMVALSLSYLGIALAFGSEVMTQPGNVVLGSFWVLLSALFYATYLLGSGRLVGRVGSLRFAGYAGLVSCVGVLVHHAITRELPELAAQPAPVYGHALVMAAVATVLPIVLTSEGIRRIGSSEASIVASVGPIATIFLGFVLLDEPITGLQMVGAGLVLAGVLAISLEKS